MLPYSSQEASQDKSVLAKPINIITRICCRNPISVIALSVFAAVFCVYWTYEHLGFKMSRLDLINPKSSFNRLWLDYIDEFGDDSEVTIVIEGKGNAEVIPVLESLADEIAAYPQLFNGILHGVNISTIRSKGLHYVPTRELEHINQFVAESRNITDNNWDQLGVNKMLDNITQRLKHGNEPASLFRTLHELDTFSGSLAKIFEPSPTYGSPWSNSQNIQASVPDIIAACTQDNTSYLLFPTQDGVIGFVLLKLINIDKTQIAQGSESISKLRKIINHTKTKYPHLKIGLTGMPILENDEMRLSNESMTKATILAFLGVGAVFMAGFGGIRHPVAGMVTLLIAFAWTMGYITIVIGHLNILSISFGAMLVGLGTDFSMHYIARYIELRGRNNSCEESLCQTAHAVGPGIVIGALTTAVAFFMASFTEFVGVAELGLISGGGMIFCLISTLIFFPALITVMDKNKNSLSSYPSPIDIRSAIKPITRFPAATLFIVLILVIICCVGIKKARYDHNLLNLQPEGLESVALEEKLLRLEVEKGGRNVWFALSIADSREELLLRKKLFAQKYPDIVVEEIVSCFPSEDNEKIHLIRQLAERLENLPERPPEIGVVDPSVVGGAIERLQNTLADQNNPVNLIFTNRNRTTNNHRNIPALDRKTIEYHENALQTVMKRLNDIRTSLRRMTLSEYRTRMSMYQAAVAGDLLTRLRSLKSCSNPQPPTINDLPASLVERFVSRGGKHLMRIYTTANIWNMDEMKKFVTAVRDIDPKATGSPLQTYESSLQMQQGFTMAALYAFIAITILLFIDFMNVRHTVAAMSPMLVGFAMMFGILGHIDIPLNPANLIVLPLILGIGIDSGVHIIHDYRSQSGKYKITASTALAVLITSLTTIIGFGSMMIASHRGLQSLGRVLVIGVACCLFTSIIALPAALTLWTKRRQNENDIDPHDKNSLFPNYTPPKSNNNINTAFDGVPCYPTEEYETTPLTFSRTITATDPQSLIKILPQIIPEILPEQFNNQNNLQDQNDQPDQNDPANQNDQPNQSDHFGQKTIQFSDSIDAVVLRSSCVDESDSVLQDNNLPDTIPAASETKSRRLTRRSA
ncbi:MAG: MMPL family transporter [Planctomycetaceae bacterium]|jgi:predicted RND superfamily exporter protein|nr:MMPL family transporter [Planctomycetaceae bacterium]